MAKSGSKALARDAPCPCRDPGETVTYGDCCSRFHLVEDVGRSTLTDPRALVRARFTAFQLGLLPFARVTESSSRPTLSAFDPRTRYKRLELLDADLDPKDPRVLFGVDVFSRGTDVSFVELSSFAIEDGRLVYVTGLTARKREGERLGPLSIQDFEARLRSS